MKMADPEFDAAANPMTVAQAQGFAHFQAAFSSYNGALRERAQWRNLMAHTLELAKKHPAVHPDFAAAIGYCFGGQSILEMVRMGCPLQGVCRYVYLFTNPPRAID
jgi:dienelactone hydrolase|eukprot:COSAG01_NODE_1137_length_11546_cov_14.463091_4_plen_106_part_00